MSSQPIEYPPILQADIDAAREQLRAAAVRARDELLAPPQNPDEGDDTSDFDDPPQHSGPIPEAIMSLAWSIDRIAIMLSKDA